MVPYDRAVQTGFVDRLIGGGTPPARAHLTDATPRPIFIVGMFRSGSTLTEQLLAALPGVAAGGEINFLPQTINTELTPFFESLAAMSAERLDGIAARYRAEFMRVSAGASFVTDKRLDNFLFIGLIKSLFPRAKIVHTVRNPLDNCLSIFFLHLEQQMSYALNLEDIGHYYREYRRLMAHWKSQYAGDIFDFSYDALVKDPQQQFKALCDFLGLPWPGEVPKVATRSAAIKTASVWQVREPLYSTSSGRSRHYLERARGIAAGACGPPMSTASMTVMPILATPLGIATIPQAEPLNLELTALFTQRAAADAALAPNPLRFSSRDDLLEWPEAPARRLGQHLIGAVYSLVGNVSEIGEAQLRSLKLEARAWFTVVRTNGAVPAVNYPMTAWCAIYCVAAPQAVDGRADSGVVRLYESRLGTTFQDASNAPLRIPYACSHYAWRPVAGQLVIFPASITHEIALLRAAQDLILVTALLRFIAPGQTGFARW